MRQYEKFDGPTFVHYLRKVSRKWGRVLPVTYNASQHKHREVRKYLKNHDGVEILHLSTATPKPGAVESVWEDAKYRLTTSEHYETLEDPAHAVPECFRTCPIRPASTDSCTAAREAKFSMIVTLEHKLTGYSRDLLDSDENVQRWHANFVRSSKITADCCVRGLNMFHKNTCITPAGWSRSEKRTA